MTHRLLSGAHHLLFAGSLLPPITFCKLFWSLPQLTVCKALCQHTVKNSASPGAAGGEQLGCSCSNLLAKLTVFQAPGKKAHLFNAIYGESYLSKIPFLIEGTHSHTTIPTVTTTQPSPSQTLVLGNQYEISMLWERRWADAALMPPFTGHVSDDFQTISYLLSYSEYCIIPPRAWLISSTLHSLQTGKLFVRNLCCFAKTISARKGS